MAISKVPVMKACKPGIHVKKPGIIMHIYDSSPGEVETGDCQSSENSVRIVQTVIVGDT